MSEQHFVHERTILFGECDPAGILYTPRICEYVVESALLFLTHILEQPFERYIFSQSMSLPARNLDVDFLKPLTWDDTIKLYASVAEVRRHAYTILITALNDKGETAFTGRLTQVCISTEKKCVTSIPSRLRDVLERLSA
ncbi:MAG: acyl-CoA thioesterase [Woeseiaceae bacterium]|nr:acyl-CoA thioesterase [Woeseiaceae bacterium]